MCECVLRVDHREQLARRKGPECVSAVRSGASSSSTFSTVELLPVNVASLCPARVLTWLSLRLPGTPRTSGGSSRRNGIRLPGEGRRKCSWKCTRVHFGQTKTQEGQYLRPVLACRTCRFACVSHVRAKDTPKKTKHLGLSSTTMTF